ncbi:MAG: phytoene desaturase [Spirochaetales bacterium]|nr:phytoene desaturase [Spirochaetales bacterium]
MKQCAVIGGGLGGLAAAISLAHTNVCDVHLYEQAPQPGGKAGSIVIYTDHQKKRRFRFDTGPTILTMAFVLEDFFRSVGEDLSDYLDLQRLETHCDYYYPDGLVFHAYTDHQRFYREAGKKLKDPVRSIKAFKRYCGNIYDLASPLFLFNSFHELDTLFSADPKEILPHLNRLDSFRTMHGAVSSYFSDERLIQLYDRYATFNGSNPYKVPATLNIIQHVESLGVTVPSGGIWRIPGALHQLAEKKGVTVTCNSPVSGITRSGRRITGITTGGIKKAYDIVVSNADVRYTYTHLLHDTSTPGALKYRISEPSSSAMVFFWGMNCQSGLNTHSILFSSDYKNEFKAIFKKLVCPDTPTVYIYISSKYSNRDCPEGCENWYVMINTPRDRGQDWKSETVRMKRAVLSLIKSRLGIDAGKYIVCEHVYGPRDFYRMTSSTFGSLYGLSSNSLTAAFLRQGNRSRWYRGLYFCGGSAHPGGGIPLTVLSGKMTADLIKKYEL